MAKNTATPKAPRLSAVERLAAQLVAAQAKEVERAGKLLDKAIEEETKATTDYERASARLTKARTTVDELRELIAGPDATDDEVESDQSVSV